jgi:hypothetical protein
MSRTVALSWLCMALSSAVARADDPARAHLGVQLRGVAGPAVLHARQELGGETNTLDGFGAAFEFALGAMVSENLALNMDLLVAYSGAADYGVLRDTLFTAIHLGAGVTYWFMPANIYLGGSIGAARSSIEGNPVRIDIELPTSDPSEIGVGAHLVLGKQWWLSRRVGLGATLSLLSSIASNPDGGESTERIVLGAMLGFCVTLH